MSHTLQPLKLLHPRVLCYFIAQFFSAFNDNAFKMVISLAALSVQHGQTGESAAYLSLTSAVFILPFLFFSGYAGYLADRYRKDYVLMFSKSFEIVAMFLALLVFMDDSHLQLLLVTLFLMATHSAFFSPSKYGIVPEVLHKDDVAKANGYLTMTTYLAIIGGTMFGGFLWQYYAHDHTVIGLILLAIAIVGTLFVYVVPKAPKSASTAAFHPNPLHEIKKGLPLIWGAPRLKGALVGSVAFWLLASLMYLTVLVYGKNVLHVSETKASALFALTAIGIGAGALWAGHLSKGRDRLNLVVYGLIILTLSQLILGSFPFGYWISLGFMALLGFGAGLFLLPLVTILTREAPADKRGQVMATSNFIDMAAVLLSSLLFWLLHGVAGLDGREIILVVGVGCALGFIAMLWVVPMLWRGALIQLLRGVGLRRIVKKR
ncbi:MAG: MFS transporter [Thalassospira sp.]|nr:MFS transporter [Thalassospira sp.]